MSELEQQEQAQDTGLETQTPGQLLRQARIQNQLSEQDVADSLNLKLNVVQTIEQDKFEQMPAATFTKGYLRSYAKLLGIDEQQVISLYEKQGVKPADPKLDMKSFSKRPKLDNGDHKFSFMPFILLLIILVAAGFFWIKSDSLLSVEQTTDIQSSLLPANNELQSATQLQTNESVVTPTQTSATAESNLVRVENSDQVENLTLTEPQTANLDTEATPNSSEQNTATVQSNEQAETKPASSQNTAQNTTTVSETESAQLETADTANNQAAHAEAINQITMKFTEDCWINIVDSTGERIAFGVKKGGRNMQISGVAPFNITLGAPENVTVSFNNQNVDMSQFKKGMVARFSLPLENG